MSFKGRDILTTEDLSREDILEIMKVSAPDVDALPNAAYFRQAHNGVYLRMALQAMVTGAV